MAEYRCVKRLKTADGVIHEVGSIVTLTGAEEQSAVRQAAVVPVAPALAQLQQERAQIDQEIAQAEHEGGQPA